jgi:hypothetical protein
VTVIVNVPTWAEALAVTVRLVWVPNVTVDGLNEAVTPEGRFEADRLMLWAGPLVVAVDMLYATEPDWLTDCETGDGWSEKPTTTAEPVVKLQIGDQLPACNGLLP